MIELTLPMPPSINHFWIGHGNKRYISREGRVFISEVHLRAMEQLKLPLPKLIGRLRVEIELTFPNHVRCDIDNRCKVLLDSLCKAGLFDDDEQFDEITLRRMPVRKPGGCSVRIGEIA